MTVPNIPATLTTQRLAGRHFETADIGAIYRQFADPEMCRFFSDPPCSLAEARGILVHYQQPAVRFVRYALFAHQSQQFIGTCGYHFYDATRRQVEIGYDIWRDYWRQGYAREVLPALLTVCFHGLDVDTVYAFIHRDNAASQAVVRRAGFVHSPPLRDGMYADEACWTLTRTVYSTISMSAGNSSVH